MGVNDARINVDFPTHRKTKRLLRRLGPAGPWYLVRLWLWAARNHPSGDLSGLSDEDIEEAIDWPADVGALVPALVECGFADGDERERALHDWADHQPWAIGADMRSAKARWNAVKKHHGETAANAAVPEWAAERAISMAKQSYQDAASSATSVLTAVLRPADSSAPSLDPSLTPFQDQEKAPAVPTLALEPDEEKPKREKPPALPDWLDKEAWRDWCAFRKRGKAPFTAHAQTLAMAKLEALHKLGHKARAVVDQSIERGWSGLFEIKGDQSQRSGYGGAQPQHSHSRAAGRPLE